MLVSYYMSLPGVKSGIQIQGTDKMLSPERRAARTSRKANCDVVPLAWPGLILAGGLSMVIPT